MDDSLPKPASIEEGLATIETMARIAGCKMITVTDRYSGDTLGAFFQKIIHLHAIWPNGSQDYEIANYSPIFDARRLRFVSDPNPIRFFEVMVGWHRIQRSDMPIPNMVFLNEAEQILEATWAALRRSPQNTP